MASRFTAGSFPSRCAALLFSGLAATTMSACTSTRTSSDAGAPANVTVAFRAYVNGAPFGCGTSFAGIGLSQASVEPVDLRFYVSDVVLVRANGEAHPVELVADGTWQDGTVALLDFEDAKGACRNGTPAVNTELRGRVEPLYDDFVGLRFRIGVPQAKNHLDVRDAGAPLAIPSLWWSWQDGYVFGRFAVRSPAHEEVGLWLGAAPYDAEPCAAEGCTADPRPLVKIDGFDPRRDAVAVDLGALFADIDVGSVAPPRGTPPKTPPSCFMDLHAGECDPLLAKLGITWSAKRPPDAGAVVIVRKDRSPR